MTLRYTLRTAFRGLRANKTRSLLTVLGIVIGVTAIILISSLGKGAQDLILGQIQGLGTRTIDIAAGKEPSGPSDFAQLFSDSLTSKDIDALGRKSNVPTLSRLVPLVYGAGSASYLNDTYSLTIYGTAPDITSIFDLKVNAGNFWTNEDVRAKAAVVVIGSKVKEELFGNSDAVGQKIRIKNTTFRVVGTLPSKGASLINFDKVALVPYTTAQDYVLGIKHFNEIIAEADTEENINRTVRDIELTLRESHGITDPDKDDFYVQTQADLAATLGMITSVLTLFLASVAGISLFVAGVGIMNIMLVSVTERTREIGLRKALGATEKNILQQFLFEAVVLTASGGVIGITLGTLLSFTASTVISAVLGIDWGFTFPLGAALIGIGVSALVGLVFGLYPARKASLKSPIEALRYE